MLFGRGHRPDDGFGLVFALYAGAALVAALLAWRLSPQVEAPGARRPIAASRWQRLAPPLGRSRGVVLHLAALFSVDALAGGLVVQSLLVLYFHLRFGVPLAALAALFFGANTLSALSFLAAAPLARRFGLLNTMVFTHLPSNLLLALVAFMPTFPLAAANGYTHAPGVHHGAGGAGRAHRGGECDLAGAQRRLGRQPGPRGFPAAGAVAGGGAAARAGGRAQECL